MSHWQDRLAALVAGDAVLPPVTIWLAMGALDHWEPGYARKSWTPVPELLHADGFLFGGYYGALADQMGTFAAMTVLEDGEAMRTSSLTIDYFRPVAEGPVTIEGRVANKSRQLLHVDVTFTRPDGKQAARAPVTFALRAVA